MYRRNKTCQNRNSAIFPTVYVIVGVPGYQDMDEPWTCSILVLAVWNKAWGIVGSSNILAFSISIELCPNEQILHKGLVP